MSDREVFPGIWVSPKHRWGQPRVKSIGVEAEMIVQRFIAGEDTVDIAADYDACREDIEDALRWGCLSREKRARLLRG